jgi:hypothetical protein
MQMQVDQWILVEVLAEKEVRTLIYSRGRSQKASEGTCMVSSQPFGVAGLGLGLDNLSGPVLAVSREWRERSY